MGLFNVQYSTDNENWTSVSVASMEILTSTTATLSGLLANTLYYVRVRTYCNDDEDGQSSWVTTSFRTACGALTAADLPLTEDFEAYGYSNTSPIDPCWHQQTDWSSTYPYPSSSAAINGSRGLYFYSAANNYSLVALPQLDATLNASSLSLRLNAKRPYGDMAKFQVGVMTDPTDVTTFTAVETIDMTSLNSYSVNFYDIDLAAYTGAGKYVAIMAPATGDVSMTNTVYIDDVELFVTPACKRIYTFGLDGATTATTATLTWVPRQDGVSTYDLAYSTDAEMATMSTLTVTGVTTHVLAGLTPNTVYYAKVRTNCGETQSEWSDVVSFRTQQVAVTLSSTTPFVEDFESGSEWLLWNEGQTNYWTIGAGTGNGGNAMYITTDGSAYTYANNATSTVYATKLLNIEDAGVYRVSYEWNGLGEGNYDYMRVFLVPASVVPEAGVQPFGTTGAPEGWLALDGGTKLNLNPADSPWQQYAANAELTAGQYKLLVCWHNDGSRGDVPPAAIDNISISYNACPEPIAVAASEVTGSSALISWTPADETQAMFFVAYGSDPTMNPSDMEIVPVENVTTTMLEGLDALTDYYVYVAAVCDDQSDWSPVCHFRTGVSCGEGYNHVVAEIGTGTSTSYYPFAYASSSYSEGYSANIYTADELTNLGLYDNNEISQIAFRFSGSYMLNGLRIYLANTTRSSFASGGDTMDRATMTEVFSGDLQTVDGWNTITLNEPFSYQTDNNLMLVMARDGSLSSTVYGYYTTVTGMGVYGYWSSYSSSLSMSTSTYRPNIQFDLCAEVPACIPVGNLRTAEVTAASATVEWSTADAGQNNFTVVYGPADDPEADGMTVVEGVTTTSYTFNTTSLTSYHVFVKAVCGDASADWRNVSFTTPCGTETLPYFEDFESMTANAVPTCWDNSGSSSSTVTGTPYYVWGVYTYGGNKSIRMYNYYVQSGSALINTPSIALPAGGIYDMSFDYCNQSSSGALLVKISTDGGASFTQIGSYTGASGSNSAPAAFTSATIDLSSYAGNDIILQFYNMANYGSGAIWVDNLRVRATPTCFPPANMAAANIVADGAELSWTPADEANTDFVVAYGAGTTPDAEGITLVNVTGLATTLTGLQPNTSYNWFVKALCSADDQSEWSSMATFRTACAALTLADLPYTEDFESYTSGYGNAISPCWTKSNNYPYPYSYSAISGNMSLYFYSGLTYSAYSGETSTTESYAALPALAADLDITSLTLRFDAKHNNSSSYSSYTYTAKLNVGVMDDPADISTFVPVQVVDLTSQPSNQVAEVEVNLASYTGSGRYVAFFAQAPEMVTSYNYNYIYVDDVELIVTPDCQRPTGVTVQNVTSATAEVSWTPANESDVNFVVTYGESDAQAADYTTVQATGSTVTLTGLEPMTDYTVYVSTDCGDEVVSEQTQAVSFYTQNNGTDVTAFVIYTNGVQRSEAVIDPVNHTVNVPIYYGEDVSNLSFGYFLSVGASATVGSENASTADFTSPVILHVTAQDANISQDWTITLTPETCPTPRDLVLSDVTRTGFTASWTSRNPDHAQFELVVSPVVAEGETVNPAQVQTLQVTSNTYAVTDLARETQYHVTVRAICENGDNDPEYSDLLEGNVTTLGLNECVIFANGTATNEYVPVYGYFCDNAQHTQSIYPAEMLASLEGKTIRSMKYFVSSGSSASWSAIPFTVKMGTTEQTLLSGILDNTGLATVYNGTLSANATDGMTVTFDQPFVYEGGNLLIDFSETAAYGYTRCSFYGMNTTGVASYTSYSPSGSQPSSFLPKVQFCYTEDACPAIAAVEASDIDVSSATINWTASEADYAGNYDLVISETEITDFDALEAYTYTGAANSYQATGLNAYTDYYMYVRVRCNANGFDDGVSTWTAGMFRTASACRVPSTPVATITGKHTATVAWENTSDVQSSNFRMVLSTTEIDPATATALAEGIAEESYDLTNLASATTYYCYIQNDCGAEGTSPWVSCTFTTPEALPAVINLAAEEISYNAFRATWDINEASFADETQWEVSCVPAGETPVWTVVNTNDYVIYGLTPATAYDLIVRPYDGVNVAETTQIAVTTLAAPGTCAVVAEGTATNTYVPVYGLYTDALQHTQSIYPAEMLAGLQGRTITSLKYFVSSGSSTSSTRTWENIPFTVKVANVEQTNLSTFLAPDDFVTVYHGTLSANTTDGMTIVLDQPIEYQGGNLLIDFTNDNAGGYSSCTFYGCTTTGSTSLMAYGGGSPSAYAFLPKVQFCYATGDDYCAPVNHLAVANVAGTTADASWYPGMSETEWQYVVSTVAMTTDELATATATTVNNINVALTGLSTDQDYYLYVRSVCGEESFGSWVAAQFRTLPTCSAPLTAVAVSDVANSATFTVTNGEYGTPESYEFLVWADGQEETDGTTYTGTIPYAVSGLNAMTSYHWKVRAICGEDDYSRWTMGNDFYVCGPITITESAPLVESFETTPTGGSTNASFVNCWNRYNNSASNYPGMPYVYGYSAHQGSHSLYWSNSSLYGDYQVVVLPAVTNDVNTLKLSFMAKNSSASDHSAFKVGVMSDPSDITTFTEVGTVNVESSTYAQYDTYLSSYTGEGQYVAVMRESASSSTTTYLDLFTLAIAESCIMPQHLAVGNITANTAEVSWTSVNPSQNNFVVTYYSEGANPTDVNVTGTSYTLTNLQANTNYYVLVKSDCGNYEYSEPTNVLTFHTACDAIATSQLPWTEDFDGYTGTAYNGTSPVPYCWEVTSSESHLPHVTSTSASSYIFAHSGTNALSFYGSGTQYAALPMFETSLNELQISFWYRHESSSYGTLTLGYIGSDDVDFNTFTPITSFPGAGTMTQRKVALNNLPEGANRLAFMWYYSGQYDCSVDDITIDYISYDVNVAANDANMGTVTGAGTYRRGTEATIEAVPNYGYIFQGWSDDVTDNPRTLTVNNDITLTANFVADPCIIRELPYFENFDNLTEATPADGKTGVQPDCWTLAHRDVSMTPEYEPMVYYNAARANSGDYSLLINKRGIYAIPAIDANISDLVMSFYLYESGAAYQLEVGVMSDLNDASTFVPIATFHNPNTTDIQYCEVNFSSYAGEGHFIAFHNTLYSGTSAYSCNYIDDLTVKYAPMNLTAVSADEEMGTVEGSGIVDYGTTATITATANEHYHFIGWSDGIMQNPRTITVVSDTTFMANFAPDQYQIAVAANNNNYGTVEGAGNYDYNTVITLTATPAEHYQFVKWSDDVVDNPRTLTVESDASYTAIFAPMEYTVTVTTNNTTVGTITLNGISPEEGTNYVSGTFNYNASVILTAAVTAEHYHFVGWSDGNTSLTHIVSVAEDMNIEAVFAIDQYTVTVASNNEEMGTVEGSGVYDWNSTATLIAYPVEGNRFTGWNDGNTDNPRTVTVTEDMTFTALFEVDPMALCGIRIADLPYTENFDSYTESTTAKTGVAPDCWTLAHKYVTMTPEYEPMVYYASASAHSGSYSLLLNKRGIYAMPQYEGDVNTLEMSLYVRQSGATYQLEVGVMSDLDDETTFVPVATLNNATTTEVTQYTVDFGSYTGAGKYIAFRNTNTATNSAYGCNYLDDITLTLRQDEPVVECGIHITDLPYTENFDGYTTSTTAKTGVAPDCWTLAHKYVTMTPEYEPMVYYASASAHSGSYSLLLNKRGIYAMPQYEGDVNTLEMSLYVRQSGATYQLEVGVMSDLNDETTFVPVATLNNATTSEVTQYTVDFGSYTGAGKYIAFRNTNVDETSVWGCNYIDDITLTLAAEVSEALAENAADDTEIQNDTEEQSFVAMEKTELSVYPNPTTGKLTIAATDEVVRVDVYDYTGRNVATFEETNDIDLSNLPSGIYTLRVTLPESTEVRRVVKH